MTWLLAAAAVALAWNAASAAARMTILYDVPSSVEAIVGAQPDGSAGLSVDDGLYQQVAGPLPADRRAGALTAGTGTPAVPSIRGLPPAQIADLARSQVDGAGGRIAFLDLGPQFDPFGPDAESLHQAMVILAATAFPGGGTYADRLHMYVNGLTDIATPAPGDVFWAAMARAGGIWLQAYDGQAQWSDEHWLAWPRALRDGLVARGMDPARLHVIVRGPGQADIWRRFRTGAACALLANGPGGYRIEDQAGFVREFRATFGATPAPVGPSAIACEPAPVLSAPAAARLANVFALATTGTPLNRRQLPLRLIRPGRITLVRLALGPDPAGLAATLGVAPSAFWSSANARVAATGPGVDTSAAVGADGSVALGMHPSGDGPIALRLTLDGLPIRRSLGPPVDLPLSLAAHHARVGPMLARVANRPTSWGMSIPLGSTLRAGPPPPRVTARVLRRGLGSRPSRVELVLSRPARRLLVEVGVVVRGRFAVVRRVRVSGRRAVVSARIPPSRAPRARAVVE